ncbi:MAG: hypothetical protein U5K53_08605 [Halanaerobiales bacterium]|nr:hypothetical protein [Halanaerobiales bacterium]
MLGGSLKIDNVEVQSASLTLGKEVLESIARRIKYKNISSNPIVEKK